MNITMETSYPPVWQVAISEHVRKFISPRKVDVEKKCNNCYYIFLYPTTMQKLYLLINPNAFGYALSTIQSELRSVVGNQSKIVIHFVL